jgi:hypothetical protein
VDWVRHCLILSPPAVVGWAASHAMVPFVREHGGGLDLLFSSRDRAGRSHTGRAELDLQGLAARVDPRPLLSPGALGAFDDSGAMGACVVRDGDRELLYYIGWSRGVTVPFTTYIGMAISDDGGRTFERVSPAPVVAGPKHNYRIVYAESADGIEWSPTGRVCIDFADEAEYAIARPCVVRDGDRYLMWFSHRGDAYRIGYAESRDGLTWQRTDERGGLGPEGDGWESESVEYPFVFDHDGTRWMLYNGNGYGATGIGLASATV